MFADKNMVNGTEIGSSEFERKRKIALRMVKIFGGRIACLEVLLPRQVWICSWHEGKLRMQVLLCHVL